MKLHVKILGYIYCGIGALIALFFLLGLAGQVLIALGVTHGKGSGLGLWGVLGLFILLITPAFWFFQMGVGLLQFSYGMRMVALIMAFILLIGLNIILLLTKDPPSMAHPVWTTFHFLMIAVGVYTIIVLLPKWGREAFL